MATKQQPVKTGEVYYRDEAGALWCAESWMREDGEVFTTDVEIEPVQDTLLE